MHIIEKIQKQAEQNQWSYPQIFEALKEAGVESYTIHFGEKYQGLFLADNWQWVEPTPKNYTPLVVANNFYAKDIRDAIINHIQGKTDYMGFLNDIAKAGASHYKVNMQTREIHYYNPNETQFHLEVVPFI